MTDYIEANHWRNVQDWPAWCVNFSPIELACRGTGRLKIHVPTLRRLQTLRASVGRPMIVTSGYRSPEHNRAVRGARNSQHVEGRAFDIRMENHCPNRFESKARQAGFTGFGFYPQARNNFMHVDTGPAREWGTRWPASAGECDAPPIRERRPSLVGTLGAIGGAGLAAAPEIVEVMHRTSADVDRAQEIGLWPLAIVGVVLALGAGGYAIATIIQRQRQEAVE